MTEPTLPLQVLVIGGAAFLLGSLLSALSYPLLRRLALASRPEAASRWLLLHALQAPLCAGLATLALLSPATAALLVPDHCHGPRCLPHAPEITLLSPGGLAIATTSFLGLSLLLLAAVAVTTRTRQRLRLLARLSEPRATFQRVESTSPLAWCAGLWQPRIFISSALLNKLSQNELELVLAHEACHARRRDNLRRLLAHWSSICWPRPLRQQLLVDLDRETEQACDAEAARRHGAHQLVDLLRRLAGSGQRQRAQTSAGFLNAHCDNRVAALTVPHPCSRWSTATGLLGLALSSALNLALLAAAAHLALEWLT